MDQNVRRKIAFVFIVFMLGLTGVVARLAMINIYDGERLRQLVADEKVYRSVTPYERGMILDRTGTKLAFSVMSYKITIDGVDEIPKDDFNEMIASFSEIFYESEEDILSRLKGNRIVVAKRQQILREKLLIKNSIFIFGLMTTTFVIILMIV